MPKPNETIGFDPDHFEDQEGNIHRRPTDAQVHIRLCGYAVLVRPGSAEGSLPQILVTRPRWKEDRREFPGGGVESHEPLAKGTEREVFEELGIDIELPTVPVAASERSFVATWTPEPVFFHAIIFIFAARFPEGAEERLRLQAEEVAGFEWVDVGDGLPVGLHPMLVPHWPAAVREARRLGAR